MELSRIFYGLFTDCPSTIIDCSRTVHGTTGPPWVPRLSMKPPRTALDCPRNHHGRFMAVPWTVHGLFMDHQGLSMEPPRAVHAPPWIVYGLFMDCHGLCIELSWTVYRLFTDCPWTTINCSWTVHGHTVDHHGFVDCPWNHHGPPRTTTNCLWATIDCLLATIHHHGLPMEPPCIAIDYPRNHQGLLMTAPWTVHGLFMDHHGLSLNFLYTAS